MQIKTTSENFMYIVKSALITEFTLVGNKHLLTAKLKNLNML